MIYGQEIMTATGVGLRSSLVRNPYTEKKAMQRTAMQHSSTGFFMARATG